LLENAPSYRHLPLCDDRYLNLPGLNGIATSMGMISGPSRAIAQQVELEREPEEVRRPKFPRAPLEREDAFIDPLREARLLLPEQTVASANVMFDTALAAVRTQSSAQKSGAFSSIYEYLLSLFTAVKRRLRGSARQKARLTARGEEALAQLRYLSLLCDASECRTPEEVLAAEGAFGEAYHEILSLSSNLVKMSEQEQAHHLDHYRKHFSSVLRSTD
jgi:hypothetical protein